jgi:hypothetical protein
MLASQPADRSSAHQRPRQHDAEQNPFQPANENFGNAVVLGPGSHFWLVAPVAIIAFLASAGIEWVILHREFTERLRTQRLLDNDYHVTLLCAAGLPIASAVLGGLLVLFLSRRSIAALEQLRQRHQHLQELAAAAAQAATFRRQHSKSDTQPPARH